MVKTYLKDTYLGGTTPTALHNEVSTCRKIYNYRENRVMFDEKVNEFYTRLLFKIDARPQDFDFPLDIDATFFNNLSLGVREFFIPEGFQIPKRLPTENNYQGNQRLLLVRNLAVEAENNIRTIKAAV